MEYLIVECTALADQYECDADRKPLCMTNDPTPYMRLGYDVYRVDNQGNLVQVHDYNDYAEKGVCICWWGEDDTVNKVVKLPYKNRCDITKSGIKHLKNEYHLEGSVNEIYNSIQDMGDYGELKEEEEEKQFVVIGEYYDDHYPTGI